MSDKRKKYSAEFKAKVALAALKNEETTAQLAQRTTRTLSPRQSPIELFKEQAKIIKKEAPNPRTIVELEKSVDEIEKYFKKGQP